MQQRRIGTSELSVSVLGLGTVKFGRTEGLKYPQGFSLPTDAEINHLLALSMDLGINLLDTAPAYGESEARLGQLITNRHQWVITTKVGEEFHAGTSTFDFTPKHIHFSVERSLRRLQTDYLDILLLHSNGDDVSLIQTLDLFAVLETLKTAGKIRAYGMSSKTLAGGLLTIERADLAMVTYHPAYTDEKPIIDQAHRQQKGIFIKKAFASGHINQVGSVENTLGFILNTPGVSSIIMGTINPAHLQQNVSAIQAVI